MSIGERTFSLFSRNTLPLTIVKKRWFSYLNERTQQAFIPVRTLTIAVMHAFTILSVTLTEK